MIPGQRVSRWWQEFALGRLRSPQALAAAARGDADDIARASERFLDDPLDGAAFDAPTRLQARSLLAPSDMLLNLWNKPDWQHVDPRLRYWSAMLSEAARKRGVPLYVHSAFRGEAAQNAAYERGVSKTPFPRSAHNIGEAVDIVHAVYHWNLTKQEWAYIAKLGDECLRRLNSTLPKARQIGLAWGGAWRFYDPAHWQLAGYQARSRVLPEGEPVRLTPRYILRHMKP